MISPSAILALECRTIPEEIRKSGAQVDRTIRFGALGRRLSGKQLNRVMEFVVSRNYVLPKRPRAFSEEPSYNLWSRKVWPYTDLAVGDILFWYESKTGAIVWKTKVAAVDHLRYARKKEVARRLHLPREEIESIHFRHAPNSGFCLAYKVKPLNRINIRKPDNFRFPHQGWLRITPEFRKSWRWRKATPSRRRPESRQQRTRPTSDSEKLTRISFNSAAWRKPTGDARKYESPSTYNFKYGFGHEDWLFRSEWLIDGWRYAFIQGVNKGHSQLVKRGQPINLTLFTIEPDKRRRYVAEIRDVECLDNHQSKDALAIFKKNGWYETMRREVKAVGGDASALGATRFAKNILNVRFRQENVTLFPSNEFAKPSGAVIKLTRYQLYDLNDKRVSSAEHRGTRTPPRAKAWMRRGYGPVQCTPEHAKMQAKLMKELRREYPRAQIFRESEFIDVSVRTRTELILFEIKSDVEPRSVIRHGLGQILEYAYHPLRTHSLPIKMVIVGRRPLNLEDKEYLSRLKERFTLPLAYRVVSSSQDH